MTRAVNPLPAVAAALVFVACAMPGQAQIPWAAGDDWPTYHHDAGRSGVDPTAPAFSDVQPAWTSEPLDGLAYGEPLYVGGPAVQQLVR